MAVINLDVIIEILITILFYELGQYAYEKLVGDS